ncbi:hypothetical protein DPX16_9131 [Anabarilius grahami]|uniref:Uncharacterized protein n=1 Tax=Anabarilius grahami TaxID=495550 RepID=A0A3N0YF86_ANAGA|nr:hypothetical protein DPX16_9131 [Anabarilius grahami]
MGMCHSFRSRLSQSAITYTGGRTGANPGIDAESGHSDSCDPQLRERRRVEEKARVKAENKRSRNIDKTLKAEKREYKQTHRLLLLDRTVESRQESIGQREGAGSAKDLETGIELGSP